MLQFAVLIFSLPLLPNELKSFTESLAVPTYDIANDTFSVVVVVFCGSVGVSGIGVELFGATCT